MLLVHVYGFHQSTTQIAQMTVLCFGNGSAVFKIKANSMIEDWQVMRRTDNFFIIAYYFMFMTALSCCWTGKFFGSSLWISDKAWANVDRKKVSIKFF